MQQEKCDEVQNPSEKSMELQHAAASSMFKGLEEEVSLVPSITSSTGSRPGQWFPSSAPASGSKGNGNRKNVSERSGRRVGPAPAVEAATQRAKTMKDFKTVETNLEKAQALGQHVLGPEALKIHDNDEDTNGEQGREIDE